MNALRHADRSREHKTCGGAKRQRDGETGQQISLQPEHAIYAHGDGLALNRDLIQACRTQLEEQGCLAIQLYGSILSARRETLDQLLLEIEARAGEGWQARAAADAAGTAHKWDPWRAIRV